ncbi:glutathione S-transferase kappa 1 [Platysternon megacephalum]|uniref:Glutathione S-transferase kappa 1 n=1 Tax=Platysternon megacephalum TaxID=55544 RepID=A0A4D9DQE6_9SAUR|nr:glutathione S-transferase kappa 1 [Platysternon megacephalum]
MLQVKVKMKRQKTVQQFFHSKASKNNQGEEHTKNQEYINMSSEVAKDGYWCTSCKKAYEEGKLPSAIIGKGGGAWLARPISKANADKLCEKATKHQASELHQHAESLISQSLSKPIFEVLNEAVKNAGDTTQVIRTNMAVVSYFLFNQEIPHNTNWRPMLSALSLVHPEVGHWFRTRLANAHYLSARNSTDWLEACSATVKDSAVEKVKTLSQHSENVHTWPMNAAMQMGVVTGWFTETPLGAAS